MESGMSEEGYEDANRADNSYEADVDAGFENDERGSSDSALAGSAAGATGGTETSQEADVDAGYDDSSDSPRGGAASDS
jgi:hypothetical protein